MTSPFEHWDPAGRTFDVVVAGQAWHWVDPVVGAAKAAQVLAPGGRIALAWNAMSFPPDFAEPFAAVYRQVLPDFALFPGGVPGGTASYAPFTEKAAAGIRQADQFTEPERWDFAWSRPYSTPEWIDIVPTFGGHSRIPPDKLAELLNRIGSAVDAAGGRLIMSYNTLVVTAIRTNPA